MTPEKKPLLLIGPLPPPYGGARVSFAMFLDYLTRSAGEDRLVHYDLPVRKARESTPAGGVDHVRTMSGIMKAAGRIGSARRLVIFGSANFCFSYGLMLLLLAKPLRTPASIRFFGGHPARTLQLRGLARSAAMQLLGLADRIVVETEVAVAEFADFLRGKIKVVHAYRNHQSNSASTPAAEPASTDRRTVRFVFVGHLTAQKGLPTLVASLKRIGEGHVSDPPVELHTYGTGDPEITRLLSSAPGIHNHGRVAQEELLRELPSYDAMVFPSVYENEGHSGAVVEALMAGLPVIATDLPALLEILEDGRNAMIVEMNNDRALAAAMRRMASDPELRTRLGKGARESARMFDADVVLPRLSESLGTKEVS